MINFTILGEPVSGKNSRELVTLPRWSEKKQAKVPMAASIKSKKALSYERIALLQVPQTARQRIEGPVRITARLYYASERPDLDASLVRDILQDRYVGRGDKRELIQRGVYRNDRQIVEEHYYRAVDKANPRTEIEIEPLVPQQVGMFHMEPGDAQVRSMVPMDAQSENPF
jgi:Holliday junction resolvase RusA-like endonuclease